MVFMDWTSIHFESQPSSLVQYGYSRDHRPDRPQITIGLAQDERSQIPVGLTIQPGNMNWSNPFQTHLPSNKTRFTNKVSCLIFDAGATGTSNLDLLVSDNMKYLSRMKLNMSDVNKHLNTFSKDEWTRVVTGNKDEEVYGKKQVFPSRIKYLYFSQRLYDDIMKNRRRHLEQELWWSYKSAEDHPWEEATSEEIPEQ